MADRCKSVLEAPGSSVFSPDVANCIHVKGHDGDHEGFYGIWGRTTWKSKVGKVYIDTLVVYPSSIDTRPPFPGDRRISIWQALGGILALVLIAGPIYLGWIAS